MQSMKRIIPRDTHRAYYWYAVRYLDLDGSTRTLGSINSERGAHDWAERLNDEATTNRHYWAEADESFPLKQVERRAG